MRGSEKARKGTVLVLGAGVSGLTCALGLRRRGYDLTLAARDFAPRVTSVVAGALWEWPPAVCGHHKDLESLERAKHWCMVSYERFAELAAEPLTTGVFLRPVTFYFRRPLADDAFNFTKMQELSTRVRGFVHDRGLIEANGVNRGSGVRDAYSYLTPMVDTDAYMAWLLAEVTRAGCRIVEESLSGSLRELEPALLARFGADAIVNCTGLGSRELADDDMTPLRGALVRIRNDGRTMPRISQAHCVAHDDAFDTRDFVFIVPRGEDWLVLGGLAEPGEWNLDIGLDNYPPIRKMFDRCVAFLPALRDAEIDAVEPIRAGLRPHRKDNVRLEREPGTRIIHNYGHGGSGVTLSWGCAREVVDEVDRLVREDDPGRS